MSLLFVRLRWDDVELERCEEILRTVPQDGELPAGCLSRQLRRERNGLAATETWDSEESGGRMDQLVTAVREAGVGREPQVAMFSVPAIFAVAYRRPVAAAPADEMAVAIPRQRGAESEARQEAVAAAAG